MKKTLLILLVIGFSITNNTAQVFKLYNNTNGLNGNLVKSLTADNSGNLWIGCSSGLNKFNGTTFTYFSTLNGLPHNNIKSLTTDVSGNVWIGTQNGLSKTNGSGFVNYNTTNGLPSNNITALASGSGGMLWIGTFSSGLSKYNGLTFTNYTTANGLITNGISSICEDLTGNIWIGTALGISVFDGTTFTNYNTGNGLPSNSIKAIYCDVSGNIWIGTNLGLVKYNGTSFSTLTTSDGLLSNFITSINEDGLGNILIGYYDVGISKYNGTIFTHFNLNNGFIWSNIVAIKSFNNNIYAGNSSGLIEFKRYLIPPDRFDYLDTNNISAGINASGYLFATPNGQPAFKVPKNTNISTIWGSSIWMGGIDQNHLLHLLGRATNAQDNDTWPGSLLSNLNTFIDDSIWNRVWKISKSEIDFHILNYNQPSYVIPKSISEWPAPTADYIDANSNNLYDPQNGDYPLIRGDQAILSIYNDLAYTHGSGGLPLGVEVHSLTYSFNSTDSAIANTVFNNYKIYNYSSNNYSDFYIGIQSNLTIGDYINDYIGCDSILSLYYGYNATVSDDLYGTHIPAQGVVFLSSPLSSFNYFNDIAGIGGGIGPETSMEYYNILNGYWMDGTSYTFGGNGHGGSVYTNYCYSSDPNNPAGWSEVTANNSPGIRTGIGKVGPFTLLAGKAICLDIAFPNAIDYFGNNLSSVSLLKERTSQIINFYNTQGWVCGEIYTDTNTVAHLYTQNPTICKGQPYQLNNIVVGGAPPYTYN
ncbi:MAG: hypothetical protein HY951_06545, partial [Bacteroidia bacterium]|nr:hypothetical protein [Bacteroidia bacterium]